MENNKLLKTLNRTGSCSQRIIVDSLLLVVIILLTVWISVLENEIQQYKEYTETQQKEISTLNDLLDDANAAIVDAIKRINKSNMEREKTIAELSDILYDEDRVLIIGGLEPPEEVKK